MPIESTAMPIATTRQRGSNLARSAKLMSDRIVSAIALLAFSPIILVTAILVRVGVGSPVLFRQTRAGLCGREFTILKFRTMSDERDSSGALLPDAQRLHKIGRMLRRTSLDEWPQLVNVLRGEMSLVGPRPLLSEYVARYTPEQARRLLVKPGITGLVQVKGRNAMEWEEKFALDVWYVDNWTLWLDVKILFRTIAIVLRAQGTSNRGHATMPEFRSRDRV